MADVDHSFLIGEHTILRASNTPYFLDASLSLVVQCWLLHRDKSCFASLTSEQQVQLLAGSFGASNPNVMAPAGQCSTHAAAAFQLLLDRASLKNIGPLEQCVKCSALENP